MKKFRFWALLLMVPILFGVYLRGQTDRATITGTVTDQNGAVLQGASVVVTNTDTKVQFTTQSNENGVYTVPSLPVGNYQLQVSQTGFKTYTRTGISPVAGQVVTANVRMAVGTASETVTVTGTPEVTVESTAVAMTMEPKAIEELPLNAGGGRNALSLLISTAPNVILNGSLSSNGTQNWLSIAGGESMSNSIEIDGTNATTGNQGQAITPGQDAIQEMQLQTNVTDAEQAQTGGGAIVYVLKSGTNRLHGSAFEYLQNEDLNANGWLNNYYFSRCAAGDESCRATYGRTKDRFNDYGGSLGGPIWKNHTFAFGDFEYYKTSSRGINPTGNTMPLPQMVTDEGGYYDLSPLLTMGAQTGPIAGTTNPCTGAPYNYGEVYDPTTWTTPAGSNYACAKPFPENHIPTGQISNISKNIAGIYQDYYKSETPLNRLINGNFPSSSAGDFWKRRLDVKVDHNFSERHHVSASYNWQDDSSDGQPTFATNLGGPWGGWFSQVDQNHMIRVIDNYTLTPSLMNTFSAAYNVERTYQGPMNRVDADSYGFSTHQQFFPLIQFSSGSNGVGFSNFGESWNLHMNFGSWNYADTILWQQGRHAVKFGWQWNAQQLNAANYDLVNNSYTFSNTTYGPTDPAVSGYVSSSFASMMMGNVSTTSLNGANSYDPRQKHMALFAQDDFKATPKLTLNLGLRWDLPLPNHMANGAWENFDPNVVNPNWSPYGGAWVFSKDNGTTFEKNIQYNEFGPHIGAAYAITPRIVAKASYALLYVPLGALASGSADYYPANQDPLNTASVTINPLNNIVGQKAIQWDDPYPTPTQPVHDSTATTFGDEQGSRVMYIHPNFLKLGMTHSFYAGLQYELSRGVVLDTRYLGTFGRRLQDFGRGYDVSWPTWSAYHALLKCTGGDATGTTIASAADAATLSTQCGTTVPYPYAGFSGPARAAIAPYPQLAAVSTQLEVAGDTDAAAKSNYNSFVVELKVRNAHGLYVNWSYAISKYTSNSTSGTGWGVPTNFSNVWGTSEQSANDNFMWTVQDDQRHLAKGYLTYDLPFGRNHRWLNQSSLLDYFVGGWTLGYYGAYGSGLPMGQISSPYGLNYYYWNNQRAVFANGATAGSIRNHFHRHFDPSNPTASGNYDFDPSIVQRSSTWYYNNDTFFGDTPKTWNKWRWNSSPASENISIVKHFGIGKEGRYQAQLRGEFYNAFNRHYFNAPDLGTGDSTFGYVTGVAGSPRVGQLAARFDF